MSGEDKNMVVKHIMNSHLDLGSHCFTEGGFSLYGFLISSMESIMLAKWVSVRIEQCHWVDFYGLRTPVYNPLLVSSGFACSFLQ